MAISEQPDNVRTKRSLTEAGRSHKRVRGRQPTTWLSTVTKGFETIHLSLSEAATFTQERAKYAQLLNSAMARCQQAQWAAQRAMEEDIGPGRK